MEEAGKWYIYSRGGSLWFRDEHVKNGNLRLRRMRMIMMMGFQKQETNH